MDIRINEELACKISILALGFTSKEEFEKYYEVTVGHNTNYRDFKSSDLLFSIMAYEKDYRHSDRPSGVHFNIMKNGDIYARYFPYYDGRLEVIPVHNQRKIQELLNDILDQNK